MDEFLDKILWEDDTTFIPLIISIEAFIQVIAVILMFCFAFGPNAPDGEFIDFLKAHKYIPFVYLIMSIIGDICLFIASSKYHDDYYEGTFYFLVNVVFGGTVLFTPIVAIFVLLKVLCCIFKVICVWFENNMNSKNIAKVFARLKSKQPEIYKQSIINEYNNLISK